MKKISNEEYLRLLSETLAKDKNFIVLSTPLENGVYYKLFAFKDGTQFWEKNSLINKNKSYHWISEYWYIVSR